MDAQNERFEQRYNEITFEAYCKAAIDHAIRRGIQKKERRAEMERPLAALNDALLFKLNSSDPPQEAALEEAVTFDVRGQRIVVHNAELAQALTYLPLRKREITLLSFFADLPDAEIAKMLDMTSSIICAVQRQRNRAVCWLRDFLMEAP